MLKSMTMLLLLIVIPISLVCWVFSLALYSANDHQGTYWQPASPWRWLMSIAVPFIVVSRGVKKKSLNFSGAVAAFVMGVLMTLSSFCFFASMLAFYFSGSMATKVKSSVKVKYEADHKIGGQRNWMQVVCNGGVACHLALIYLIETGSGEYTVDFRHHYGISWISMAILGSLSCSSGDTLASELGSVYSSGDPWLITSFRKVPKGTNGGVSLPGLLFSWLGGVLVGLAFYGVLLLSMTSYQLQASPAQWPVVIVAGIAGLIGSLIDSLLGATLQFSGYDRKTGFIVEQDSDTVDRISGVTFFDNHAVNLLSSFLTCLVTPRIAMATWSTLVFY